jgi:hypothetical protein
MMEATCRATSSRQSRSATSVQIPHFPLIQCPHHPDLRVVARTSNTANNPGRRCRRISPAGWRSAPV